MPTVDRKFLDWDYTTPDGRKYSKIEIRYKQPRAGAEFPFTFYCHFKSPEVTFMVEDGSVDGLRQQIVERLDSLNQLTWTGWLFVAVREPDRMEPPGDMRWSAKEIIDDGLSLTVHRVERAQDARGEWFWRYTRDQRETEARPKSWAIRKGIPWEKDRHETVAQKGNQAGFALIPDSPEIRAKLQEVVNALKLMRYKLSEVINTDDAVKQLLGMRTVPRLAAPGKKG